jgi:putative addiction module killer protein
MDTIGVNGMIKIHRTKEFETWFESLTVKEQLKVESRLEKIHNLEYFGDAKNLGDGLAELRWANGWRVYFTKERSLIILLLSGGNKNAQKKDIQKARILIQRYARN